MAEVSRPRRPLHWRILRWTGFVLGGLVLLLAVAIGFLETGMGRRMLAGLIEDLGSTPDQGLKVGELQGSLFDVLTVSQITLTDREGDWLRLEQVTLDWSPSALLSGELAVGLLQAEAMTVLRPPVGAPAPESPEPFALPDLPFAVDLERLSLQRLTLEEPVLGTPATLRLEASAQLAEGDAGGDLATKFLLERQDGTPGRIALTSTWQPAADTLALDLTIAEPRGGLLARVLALEGLPAVDLDLKGSGPLSDWRGRLLAALDGQPVADLTLSIDGRERRRIALQGQIQSSPLIPAEGQPWTAGGMTLDMAAAVQDQLLTIEQLHLASAAFDFTAAGTAEIETQTLNLTAGLRLEDPAVLAQVLPDITVGAAEIAVTAKGPLAAPVVTADVTAQRVDSAEAGAERLALQVAATPLGPDALQTEGYRLDVKAQIATPRIEQPELTPWPWGDITLDALVTLDPALNLGIEQARVQGQDLDLATSGMLTLADMTGALKIAVKARTPEIAGMVEAPLGVAMTGDLTLGAAGAMAATVDATITGAEALPDRLGAVLGPEVKVTGGMALAGNGDLTLEKVALTARGATVTADGTYGEAGVDLTWRAEVADLAGALAPFEIPAAGAATLEGSLAGPSLEEMTLLARLDGKQLTYQQVALGDVTADVAVAGLPNAPTGSITLDAPATAYGPLALKADVAPKAGGGVTVEPLDLKWGEALALTGRLESSPEGLPLTGKLSGRVAQSPLLDQLGVPLSGSGTIALDLIATEGRQDAAIDLQLGAGSLAGLAHGGVTLKGRVSDLLGTPMLKADATLANLAADPAKLSNVTVSASGSLEKLKLTVRTQGDLRGPLDLTLNGELAMGAGGTRFTLAPFSATVAEMPFSLNKAVTVRLDGGATRIDGLVLAIGKGTVTIDAVLGGGNPSLELKADNVDLADLDPLFRQNVPQGTLDLALSLKGSRGTFTLNAQNVAMRRSGLSLGPAFGVRAEGTLAAGKLDLRAVLDGDFGRDLTLDLQMPLVVALDRYEVSTPDGPLSGHAAWHGEAAQLVDFLPFDNQILSGPLDLDITLAGTVSKPAISGHLTLTEGHYENLLSGTVLANLTIKATGEGKRLDVAATATDGLKGNLTLDGGVDLAAADGLGARMQLKLSNFALLQRDDLFARVVGELAIVDQGNDLVLTGKLTGDRIELDIGADLPPSVATLDVVVLKDGQPVNPPKPEKPDGEESTAVAPFSLGLDIAIDLPQRVFVRGSGLESEWAGALLIRGTTALPRITGRLEPQRGVFNLLGSEFQLQGGSIDFDGGAALDPSLNLRAVYENSDITAIVQVRGRASRPEISMASQPPLPQEEVLSRVLFDRGTGQISALEAVQLAEAAAILSGATGSDKTMVDRLRQSFGLDVLRLEGGDSAEAVSATVGQYLSKGLFIGLTGGTVPGETGAKIEYEVSPEIVVEGQLGEKSKVAVRWQWDY